jgi:stage II sporulation protein AA (anti-sigma F factor antagonist)
VEFKQFNKSKFKNQNKIISTPHCDKFLKCDMLKLKKRADGAQNAERREEGKMCAARDRKPGFDSEFTGTVLKIKLRGEIDHHSAVAVRTAIDDMIRSKRPAELVIDMSAVDFMDSSGLGLIMGRYNTIKDIGGSLTVADPTPATEKIMKLAGLERIIKIRRSPGKAQTGYDAPKWGAATASVNVRATNRSEVPTKTQKKRNEEKKNGKNPI